MTATADLADAATVRFEWWNEDFALRDAWHAVEHAPAVTTDPMRRAVHQAPYFLWRENGVARASERHPSDMRAPGPFSPLTRDGFYPLVERYGLIWVWFGEPANANPDLVPDLPFLPLNGGMPRHTWGTCLFDCTYELACENSMDTTHADYLHFGVVGRIEADADGINVVSDSEKVIVTRDGKNRVVPRGTKPVRLLPAEAHDIDFVNIIHLRNGILTIRSNVTPPNITDYLFIAYVPEGRYRTRMNYVQYQVGGPIQSPIMKALTKPLTVLAAAILPGALSVEDNLAFTHQQHNYIDKPSDRRDANSRYDLGGLTYRKRMRELVARQRGGDFAYEADALPGADISHALRMPDAELKSGPRFTALRANVAA